MIFLKKRSQIVLKPAIEIIVAVAILLLFLYVGRSYGTGEVFEKVMIANNAVQSANIALALPDYADLTLPGDLSDIFIKANGSSIKIFSVENDPTQVTRFFARNQQSPLVLDIRNPSAIRIIKSGNEVALFMQKPLSENMRCPSIKTENPNTIAILPATINEMNYEFAQALAGSLPNAQTKNTVSGEALAVELMPTAEKNRLTAYITPNLESRRMACLIINNLMEINSSLEAKIIPSERYPLSDSRMGVSLEFNKEMETSATI